MPGAIEDRDGQPQPRLLTAGGHELNVLSMGPAAPVPSLLVHGFGGDLQSWALNQATLAEARGTHALDLPGHGRSSATYGKGSARALSEAVAALMDTLHIEKAHVIGHSMGGAIALLLAIGKPERVASVTAIAPGGLGPELNRTFIDGFIAADTRDTVRDVLGLMFARAERVSEAMVAEALAYKQREGSRTALEAIAAANFTPTGQKSGLRELLPAIPVPVQIIWGREDKIIPVQQAENLPAQIHTTILDGVGHMPHMERASDVNRLISGFVSALDSPISTSARSSLPPAPPH